MVDQTNLLVLLSAVAVVMVAGMAWAVWKLLKTMEALANRVEESLRQFELTAEDIRRTNGIIQEIMAHAGRGVANVEHVTEGVRKFRKTLDAATAVLDIAVIPVLGNVAGVLAGTRAAASHVVNRLFRKEGHHGE